jgi:hypothetical protein
VGRRAGLDSMEFASPGNRAPSVQPVARRCADSAIPAPIKMDLTEIGCGGMDWIHLAQDKDQLMALVNTVMTFQVP